jgi:hypothetical protein
MPILHVSPSPLSSPARTEARSRSQSPDATRPRTQSLPSAAVQASLAAPSPSPQVFSLEFASASLLPLARLRVCTAARQGPCRACRGRGVGAPPERRCARAAPPRVRGSSRGRASGNAGPGFHYGERSASQPLDRSMWTVLGRLIKASPHFPAFATMMYQSSKNGSIVVNSIFI